MGHPLLNLFINGISARLAPQTLSIKDECSFRFSNVLIIGLGNSSADCWFRIISLLTASPRVFSWKSFKPLKQDFFDIHHNLDF